MISLLVRQVTKPCRHCGRRKWFAGARCPWCYKHERFPSSKYQDSGEEEQ